MSQAGPLDPTHLSLGIGLQPEQTAHLQGLRLDDASPHKVFRVGVHVVQESRAKPQKLRRKRGARPVSSQTVARQFPKPISQKGEGEVQREGAATAPHMPEPEQGRLGCLTPISHLGLGDFWVHGVVGFEDFLRLLLGAEAGKRGVRAPPPQLWAAHPGPAVAPPPAAAHRLSCFQRWKKSWAAISVGWKNLLMVTGSFRVRDWGAPPYLARKEEDSIRSRPSPRSPARLADPTDSPEAHRQERRCQEVAQTLDIEHLLHLRPAVHLRGHALGLHGQLCAPSLRKPETGGGSSWALLRTSKGPGLSSQVQPTRPSSRVLPMLNHWPSTMDSATSMTAHCHIVLRQETP